MLLYVKNLGGRFSLCLFVDDVDNEPPVLLESCNISLSISSAGARGGIKCSAWYERSGRFLARLLHLHSAHFYLFFFFFCKLSAPYFSNLQTFLGSTEAEMFFNNISLSYPTACTCICSLYILLY